MGIFAKYVKNDDYNMQTKFGVQIASNIFKITKFSNYTNPLTSQLWKLTLPLEEVVGSKFFSKIRRKDDLKGCRMGRSDKISLWYVSLLINTRFRFFILE